jgi:hypothetical protein
MRNLLTGATLGLMLVLMCGPFVVAVAQDTSGTVPNALAPSTSTQQSFDPHDIYGNWIGDRPSPGRRNFASWDQKIPEPPLTTWAKTHLLMKSISHDGLYGKLLPGGGAVTGQTAGVSGAEKDRPRHICPNNQDPCYATDPNGVPANVPTGEFPGKDCEPLAAPAIYDYPGLDLITFLAAPDRIFQLHNYHREWRVFWLNRDHPKDVEPTFEGDSVAHWDGNTLEVDTIGFNGKTMITQSLGQWKSDAFHLTERFTVVDREHLVIDMTYCDPKAWGNKCWPGFRRYYHRASVEKVHDNNYKLDPFSEWICDPGEDKAFDQFIMNKY